MSNVTLVNPDFDVGTATIRILLTVPSAKRKAALVPSRSALRRWSSTKLGQFIFETGRGASHQLRRSIFIEGVHLLPASPHLVAQLSCRVEHARRKNYSHPGEMYVGLVVGDGVPLSPAPPSQREAVMDVSGDDVGVPKRDGGCRAEAAIRQACPHNRRSRTMSDVPVIELNDGVHIPQLGFGVFQIEPETTAAAVKAALQIGYRHIDTAEMYGNEKGVGQGIRDAGLDRADVFITSKLNNGFHRPDDARRAFDKTLSALESDYVDLFLIHWPLPTLYGGDFVSTWNVLEEFARDGRARSIGVSNFQPPHLDRLAAESSTVPAVNQIEVHPYLTNEVVRAYGQEHGIATEAWSPIAQGKVLGDPVIERIADGVGRSPAQVVLRWHIQRGDIVFPKSVSPGRMKANFELFDFELDSSDMAEISALDRGESGRTGPNPDTFDYIPD